VWHSRGVRQSTWCSFWQPRLDGDKADGKKGGLLDSPRKGVSGCEQGKEKKKNFTFRLFLAVLFSRAV